MPGWGNHNGTRVLYLSMDLNIISAHLEYNFAMSKNFVPVELSFVMYCSLNYTNADCHDKTTAQH